MFLSAAISRAAPQPEMLRMMQSALERPKLIDPNFGTRVECDPFCAIISLRVGRQAAARKSVVGRAPSRYPTTSFKTLEADELNAVNITLNIQFKPKCGIKSKLTKRSRVPSEGAAKGCLRAP